MVMLGGVFGGGLIANGPLSLKPFKPPESMTMPLTTTSVAVIDGNGQLQEKIPSLGPQMTPLPALDVKFIQNLNAVGGSSISEDIHVTVGAPPQ